MYPELQALVERVSSAAASGTPLRIKGGGSKDFYGGPLHGEVLETGALNGIQSYEPSELVVTVRAGTPLATLEATLAERGQCLPFEPPHFGHAGSMQSAATVGGMVAAGLSGPARASVGSARDYLLGARLLNGQGQLLSFGGQVMKNVAGYDVSRLMAGAMGVLGVLVELSLKVMPVAPAEATLRFELGQADALRQLHAWGGQPLPLNASCWVADAGTALLFVRLRGAVAAVAAACSKMGGEKLDTALVAPDWQACREQTLPFFAAPPSPQACLWRLSVPQTTPVLDLPQAQLIEWHGGLRWLWAPAQQALQVRAAARAAGGHATLFRAAPGDSRTAAFQPLTSPLDRIHRELKKQFDPAGIFNRGRLYPEF